MTRKIDNMILAGIFTVGAAVLYIGHSTGAISMDNIVLHGQRFENFVATHHLQSIIVFSLVYIAAVAASLPGTALLTVAGGFMYGTLAGTLYSCTAATTGAVIAFLAARYVIRGPIERKMQGPRMSRLHDEINSKGSTYLLAMRLTFLPIWFINLCAAMTRITIGAFVWTTFAGIIPRTLVYAYTGRQLAAIDSIYDIFSPGLITALVLVTALAVVPIAWQRRKARVCADCMDHVGTY